VSRNPSRCGSSPAQRNSVRTALSAARRETFTRALAIDVISLATRVPARSARQGV
jgi:hypothetical protein